MIRIERKRGPQRLIDAAWRRIAQKPANLDRRDDFQPCLICGRPVDTKSAGTRWIHVIEGGSHAAEPGDVIDQAGDLYFHPIGSDCLRNQPALKPVAKRSPAAEG